METIAIDCRFASTRSGIGRYTRELVPALLQEAHEMQFNLLVRSRDEKWLEAIRGHFTILETGIPHYSLKEQTHFPKLLKDSGADLLFSPHFNVPFFCPLPFVITIHDLILHWYPNQASAVKRLAYLLLMSRSVRMAKGIIAVSEFTRKELRLVYGKGVEKKIAVIPEGVSSLFVPQSENEQIRVREAYGLRKSFFLYVGNAKEHKNVQMLIDAFQSLHPEDTELVLVSSGREVARLQRTSNVRLLASVPDEDLPALYSAALAFVTASSYEGFCLPVAEAQACRCPVIASNRGALPEVADEHALLVEPSVRTLADALEHPPPRKAHVNVFHWRDTAAKTLSILRSAL